MKRLLIILLLCALILTGCAAQEPEILFDEAAEGIVSVILEDYNDGTIHYDTIGPDGQRQPAQPCESVPLEILTAAEARSPKQLMLRLNCRSRTCIVYYWQMTKGSCWNP